MLLCPRVFVRGRVRAFVYLVSPEIRPLTLQPCLVPGLFFVIYYDTSQQTWIRHIIHIEHGQREVNTWQLSNRNPTSSFASTINHAYLAPGPRCGSRSQDRGGKRDASAELPFAPSPSPSPGLPRLSSQCREFAGQLRSAVSVAIGTWCQTGKSGMIRSPRPILRRRLWHSFYMCIGSFVS